MGSAVGGLGTRAGTAPQPLAAPQRRPLLRLREEDELLLLLEPRLLLLLLLRLLLRPRRRGGLGDLCCRRG